MALIVAIGGCSLSLSGPDPMRAAHVAPRCDTGKGPVAADWVFAGLAATIALSALSDSQNELAGVSALTAVAFAASALRGNGVVNGCREEVAAYSEPMPDVDTMARVPRRPTPPVATRAPQTFEDPYAEPADLPARRVVAPRPIQVPPTTAPPAGRPVPVPAPPVDDDWSAFWTELP